MTVLVISLMEYNYYCILHCLEDFPVVISVLPF